MFENLANFERQILHSKSDAWCKNKSFYSFVNNLHNWNDSANNREESKRERRGKDFTEKQKVEENSISNNLKS